MPLRSLSNLAIIGLVASAAQPSTAEVISAVSVSDARTLLTDAGAQVQKVDFDKDSFTITASIGPERHVWFEGMNCSGGGDATTCTEFKVSAHWDLGTAARAEAMAKQLNYNYTSVFADGSDLYLWRMDFTYGGITKEHLRRTVLELFELRSQAENTIWPPAKAPPN